MSTRIVVIGAGYAGLLAALKLTRRRDTDVVLLNDSDRFVERVRLHEHATGRPPRDLPLADLVAGTDLTLVTDTATAFDDTAVHTASGDHHHYDLLVLATGSTHDDAGVPGVRDHTHSVADSTSAHRLHQRLRALPDHATVTVVGGGLTGIETAAEIAETFPRLTVRLVTDDTLGPCLSPRGRHHIRTTLTALGVDITEHHPVTRVDEHGLHLTDDTRLDSDVVVWATGFRAYPLAARSGLTVDHLDRVVVDPTLQSVSHPRVHAIGDAAALRTRDGLTLRMACATGLPSGAHLADVIGARLDGRPPRPLRFRYLNQCISLGRYDALVQFVHRDDTPTRAVLTGRLAALYKELIVRATVLVERHPAFAAMLG
ncbi:NAD(P)/FAD-dependent oxidoreductase [Saccharomonospora sp. NB11]|jgi:NADH dehydrogenase|uniref:NAD(P)/FAD-dependent oxidoreductase n=1 Tax=Saccharomonospora sp. NB11 TaxID=1642298 RepID=UPI0018D0D55E|nr:FAD-dependent oxidoreductase [Saccharomonospora sp. NB11]